jgi:hypothetical protein
LIEMLETAAARLQETGVDDIRIVDTWRSTDRLDGVMLR